MGYMTCALLLKHPLILIPLTLLFSQALHVLHVPLFFTFLQNHELRAVFRFSKVVPLRFRFAQEIHIVDFFLREEEVDGNVRFLNEGGVDVERGARQSGCNSHDDGTGYNGPCDSIEEPQSGDSLDFHESKYYSTLWP